MLAAIELPLYDSLSIKRTLFLLYISIITHSELRFRTLVLFTLSD
jgi:hypothetical protein